MFIIKANFGVTLRQP